MFPEIKRRKSTKNDRQGYFKGTLEDLMSLGLGSGIHGETLTQVRCANRLSRGSRKSGPCPNVGVEVCAGCGLVKYCSVQCQTRHWHIHRRYCEHPLLDVQWEPCWVRERRKPTFSKHQHHNEIPAFDCLGIPQQWVEEFVNTDFKLCFIASQDIRNLVRTINSLPKDYKGKCDILFNDTDSVSINKNLVILYALLSAGPSIEESAELAMHLMYSSALTPASAAYLRGCIRMIYDDGTTKREQQPGTISFKCALATRGPGMIFSMQSTLAMKQPMAMFLSRYGLQKGLKSMRSVLSDPVYADDRDRHLESLEPAHRLALARFRETGFLAPFSVDTQPFTQPNRLMFDPNGNWLGSARTNPLRGWDVSDIQTSTTTTRSAEQHGLVEAADIMGCLFFHVKRELMEFARRMKEFQVDLYLTQFDPQLLSKGVAIGVFPAFTEGCFDCVDTADVVDDQQIDVRELLTTWGPMLNRSNEHACILMRSRHWYQDRLDTMSVLHSRPQSVDSSESDIHIEERFQSALDGEANNQTDLPSARPLDDREIGFGGYFDGLGLRVRSSNRVYPKRFGFPLNTSDEGLPDVYYNLFTLGELDVASRYIEIEVA